jgi:hypothetical protein
MSTALQPLRRSYAVADLNVMEPKPASKVIQALNSKKRKATDNGDETDPLSTDGPDAPEPPPKRKPGRPKGSKNKASNQQLDPKTLEDTGIEMSPPKASEKLNVVPPRSPLPNRINRVVNPGRPDAKRAKRTSAEVTAAAKRKEVLRQEIAEHERRKIQALAEIEMQEEMEAAEEENSMVNRDNGMEDEEAPPQSEGIMEEDPIDKSAEITADPGVEPNAGKNAPAKKAPVCSPPDCVDATPWLIRGCRGRRSLRKAKLELLSTLRRKQSRLGRRGSHQLTCRKGTNTL